MLTKRFLSIGLLTIILAISIVFRLSNLGYSEFQGDEVAAQNYLFDQRSFATFLLTRTIGPGQYIVTYIANLFFLQNNPELYVRLPFAIAGTLLIIICFLSIKAATNNFIAALAALFLATSGLLIAFSRFAQYQSFVLVFSIIAIYSFYNYVTKNNRSYLLISAMMSAFGLLFHYDSLAFIVPIALILLVKKDYKGLAYYLLISGLLSSIFYLPFILHPQFKQTFLYLFTKRISSDNSFDNVNYTVKLLGIYHSKEWLIALAVGIALWLSDFIKTSKPLFKLLIVITVIVIITRGINIQRNPIIEVVSITGALLLCFYKLYTIKVKKKLIFMDIVELWFLISFITYVVIISKSLTHFYNALVPAVIISSFYLAKFFYNNKKLPLFLILLIPLVAAISFNYEAFINSSPEYPWHNKNYIFGKMPAAINSQNKLDGMFGFPYYRGWREIADEVHQFNLCKDKCKYSSNEKYRLTKYYFKNQSWVDNGWNVYVQITNPQSLLESVNFNYEPIIQTETYSIYTQQKNTFFSNEVRKRVTK